MAIEPLNWNVVVAGYWNPAILTPSGIALRLFGLEKGTPILVELPLEALAPTRVRHEGLTVTAEMGRLAVNADRATYGLLDRARQVAAKAIEDLPVTPLSAAGYNVRFRMSDPPDDLLTAMECGIDNSLSDAGFSIDARSLRRSLKLSPGIVNLSIEQEKEEVMVEFNFHCQSSDHKELVAWMQWPIDKIRDIVSRTFKEVFEVQLEEVANER